MTDADQPAGPPAGDGLSVTSSWGEIYAAISTRRTAFDTLLWQTPALGLAAQAFLFTIALSPDSSRLARFISAALSLVSSLVAMQTMSKHRYNERTDAMILEKIERVLGVSIHGRQPHARPKDRGEAVGNLETGANRFRTFDLWLISLGAFAVASVGVIVVTLTNSGLLKP